MEIKINGPWEQKERKKKKKKKNEEALRLPLRKKRGAEIRRKRVSLGLDDSRLHRETDRWHRQAKDQ